MKLTGLRTSGLALLLVSCTSERSTEPCHASVAICNGVDDDCDGEIDEITAPCQLANATAGCSNGVCALVQCEAGYADCDTDPANGCEAFLSSLTDCGGCGILCDLPHTREACIEGACVRVVCDEGYDDCDTIDANGCETRVDTLAHCGACGALCSYANAAALCDNGDCEFVQCSASFFDCDGDLDNGCESQQRDIAHCGGCNQPCGFRNGEASCATGACAFVGCLSGFFDCDENVATGCESAAPCAPPVIEDLAFTVSDQQASCDITTLIECEFRNSYGILGVVASEPIVVTSTYTEARLEAHVTDPQSTPELSDIAQVVTRFTRPFSTSEQVFSNRDDGGAQITRVDQMYGFPSDCTRNDTDGTCNCYWAQFDLSSNDAEAGDDVFSLALAFVRNIQPGHIFADCIARARQTPTVRTEWQETNTLHVEATDLAGRLTEWSPDPTVTTGDGSTTCSGDACACCLIRAMPTGDTSSCAGLPGMVSPSTPNGTCVDLL
ncbi:MAG: hypothetical protein HYZ27_00450 [Deltaproteobacteria bacterium]|nr:hypothetical protein [Deltaproteobacteria bacterium]